MTPLRAGAAATLSGFAVMALELSAVRLFAPYFGDSAFVWTNVIGVLLLALALGAWIGGRLAEGDRAARRLGPMLFGAGIVAALVPWVTPWLGGALLPPDLPMDAATAALVRGSLAATAFVLAPPVLLAGTVTPLLVTALTSSGVTVGRAAGLVGAFATLGSLAGTFAATHALIPWLGTSAAVWVCAAAWIVAGLLCSGSRRAALLLLVPGLAVFTPAQVRRPVPGDAQLVAEVESRYQYLQVVDEPAALDSPARRVLKINEGLDSFHSVRVAGTPLSGKLYYDYHLAAGWLRAEEGLPEPLRVLSLGAAAGTFERVFHAVFPSAVFDSVEIDPAVVEIGRRYFGAFSAGGRVWSGFDARVFVELATGEWDVVLVDAYERQIYLPAHVASREFFTAVYERLSEGGVVSVNVGGRHFDDPAVAALGRTMASVFGASHAFRVPYARNFVLLARRGRPLDPDRLTGVSADGLVEGVAEVLDDLRRRGAWHRFDRDSPGEVLVDDRPFLDVAQERTLWSGFGPGTLLAIAGDADPALVTQEVYELALAADWAAVVERVVDAQEPTGYLRLIAGDARWHLHDWPGARAEWLAAQELGVDAQRRTLLAQRLEDVEAQLRGHARAAAIGTRNGWLTAVALAFVVAVGIAVARWGRRP